MIKDELIQYYSEKKIDGALDFSAIKKELIENHQIPTHQISEYIDAVAANEIHQERNKSSQTFFFKLFFAALGVVAIGFSVYYIINPVGDYLKDSLSYLCLIVGGYVFYRNLRFLKG